MQIHLDLSRRKSVMVNLANEMASEKKYKTSEEIEEPFKFARKWENLHSSICPFNIKLPGLQVINIRNQNRTTLEFKRDSNAYFEEQTQIQEHSERSKCSIKVFP